MAHPRENRDRDRLKKALEQATNQPGQGQPALADWKKTLDGPETKLLEKGKLK